MYTHILVPIAPDHGPMTAESIKIAQSLCAEGGKITVVTVLEPTPGYVASYIPEDMIHQQHVDIMENLKADIADVPNSEAHVVSGHAGATIVDYATDNGADCIIIASHKPGLQDFFLGSTASRVVRHAPCAVHVMR